MDRDKGFKLFAGGVGCLGIISILISLIVSGLMIVGLWLGVKWLWFHV